MRIFVAGHRGMVGGAILRQLELQRARGEPIETITRRRSELDLTNQAAVREFMVMEEPDVVILA
ncbi:MAG: NAD-dependent epimerase/dehydratase family protein, partial [Hyphomicrobiaceae bacterium]